LVTHYEHFTHNPALLKDKLNLLRRSYSKIQIHQWHELIDGQQWSAFVQSLLEEHYDPAYRRSMQRQYTNIQMQYELPDLSVTSLQQLVNQLATTTQLACN